MQAPPVVGSYKGHPTLTLDPDSKFPFTLGLRKALLVITHLKEIQEFVARFASTLRTEDHNGQA